ncbi:retrovirus-related pol polyprotein from transposon TNT 1-94 [Tanacetum coccineum]|uniref:Retrovirus-related pol polyprotein from transposon TNT 1-94 n=1 Tax=Tanacetum coccineum TaxID=301880 RepID=A0ABQ5BHF2_9ASTR
MKIKESLNVTFDETPPPSKTSPLVDDDLDEEEAIKVTEKRNLENDIEDETLEIDEIVDIKESRNHPFENLIGDHNQRTLSWLMAMQEELNQFITNDVWELVPQPKNMTIIGTKWVFRNKLDENDIVSRNKARLVAQGYNQQEGIDYDETYAPVARLESIRILLAYAYALDFKLFQMDVKSAFLNGFINEEVYVAQPLGFIDFEKPDHVYKLKKALYGLKQAPKACYDRLKAFLIKHEYKMGMAPKTSHLEAVKRIFRYIKGTTHLGLWYPKGTDIETVVYADSDHAGDYMDRKSTNDQQIRRIHQLDTTYRPFHSEYRIDLQSKQRNLFDFETPLCKAFNDFNYLLKIDTDLVTFDIQGIGMYEEYELNNHVTRFLEEPCSDIDGFCNGEEQPGMVWVGSITYFQDHKRNASSQDNQGNEERRDDPALEPSVYKIRRFEMMKYSFNADEEYISIKESEYLNHSKDNLDAYRELLHIIDEGWVMATPDEE